MSELWSLPCGCTYAPGRDLPVFECDSHLGNPEMAHGSLPEAEVLAVIDLLSWETGTYEGGADLNEAELRTAEAWTWKSTRALHSSMKIYEIREIMKSRAG